MNEPSFTVKKEEWDKMAETTKKALAAVAKYVQNLTPEQFAEIKNRPIRNVGSKKR